MNQKRAVIEQFIEKDLLDAVAVELSSGALAQESSLAQQLEEVTKMIRDNFGADALDAKGNLIKYADSPRGQQYLELREKVGNAKTSPELESDIFNHLYAFFSRQTASSRARVRSIRFSNAECSTRNSHERHHSQS